MTQVKQVEGLEAFKPHEVKPEQKKVIYFIIKVEYVPKPSKRKFLNKNKE